MIADVTLLFVGLDGLVLMLYLARRRRRLKLRKIDYLGLYASSWK